MPRPAEAPLPSVRLLSCCVAVGAYVLVQSRLHRATSLAAQAQGPAMTDRPSRPSNWRMPPLSTLERPVMSMQRKIGMLTLRGYLFFAFALVIVKVVDVAIANAGSRVW